MRDEWRPVAAALLGLLLMGCPDESDDPAAGGPGDGGAIEAGTADGSAGDAAPALDATPEPDASRGMDAAAQMDAAPEDDAAPAVDAEPDAVIAVDAAPDLGRAVDAGIEPDVGIEPDAGGMPGALCAVCVEDAECAALGDGARCVGFVEPRRCLQGCAGDPDSCPEGFGCFADLCQPPNLNCESCQLTGCPAGEGCNEFTGACEPRGQRCGACEADQDCRDELFCRMVGFGRACVEPCEEGDCDDGFACDGGACLPEAGFCDNCGGCGGERPVCNAITRECLACGPGFPCDAGQVCTLEGECEAPEPGTDCITDLDCRDPAQPRCVEQQCILCVDDAGCPAATTCEEGACVEGVACDGVECQAGTACVEGRCLDEEGALGCAADADCAVEGGEGERRCNVETGQCYRDDQRCDALTAVCAPGGECRPPPFSMEPPSPDSPGVCSCAKRDPADVGEPNPDHRIPCQPGGVCVQLSAEPGGCVRAP